jgi:hypothetical protein
MPRDKRQADNQAIMRRVNTHVLHAARGLHEPDTTTWYFFCECAVTGCGSTVQATLNEYGRVRSEASVFLVAPGHEDLDREKVVERTDQFVVVRASAGEPVPVGLS